MTTTRHYMLPRQGAGTWIIIGMLGRRTSVLLSLLLSVTILIPVSTKAASPAHGTWTMTGSLRQPRAFAAAIRLRDGDVLVAGGCATPCGDGAQVSLASAELYNPHTGSWTITGSMHDPRLQYTLTRLPNGDVLAVGGCSTTGCTSILASAELYDPQSGAWTLTDSLNNARALHTSTLLRNGQVLVTGGCGIPQCSAVVAGAELFNPATNTWTLTSSLHNARSRQNATLLPTGQVLVAGGCATANCSSLLASAELYSPRTGLWTPTGSLSRARADYALVLLRSGQVLAAGGNGPNGLLASTEVYNPSTGTWTTTGSMSLLNARAFETPETATLLPSGQVLVAGDGGGGAVVGSTELYNTSRHAWTLSGSLRDARTAQTTSLLSNGQVLVAGGLSATGGVLGAAEVYHP